MNLTRRPALPDPTSLIAALMTMMTRFSCLGCPRLANRIRRSFLHDGTPDTGCGIKLFEREAFLSLPAFNHMHRYLPALMQRAGWRTVSVPVNHRPRGAGRSKYTNFGRALVGIRDLLGVSWLVARHVRARSRPVQEARP